MDIDIEFHLIFMYREILFSLSTKKKIENIKTILSLWTLQKKGSWLDMTTVAHPLRALLSLSCPM